MAEHNFLICITNSGYEASLELHKLYELVPDEDASRLSQVRIIDESGEDYLYPASFFTRVTLPSSVVQQLLQAA